MKVSYTTAGIRFIKDMEKEKRIAQRAQKRSQYLNLSRQDTSFNPSITLPILPLGKKVDKNERMLQRHSKYMERSQTIAQNIRKLARTQTTANLKLDGSYENLMQKHDDLGDLVFKKTNRAERLQVLMERRLNNKWKAHWKGLRV